MGSRVREHSERFPFKVKSFSTVTANDMVLFSMQVVFIFCFFAAWWDETQATSRLLLHHIL